jgi:hypothetical protein
MRLASLPIGIAVVGTVIVLLGMAIPGGNLIPDDVASQIRGGAPDDNCFFNTIVQCGAGPSTCTTTPCPSGTCPSGTLDYFAPNNQPASYTICDLKETGNWSCTSRAPNPQTTCWNTQQCASACVISGGVSVCQVDPSASVNSAGFHYNAVLGAPGC